MWAYAEGFGESIWSAVPANARATDQSARTHTGGCVDPLRAPVGVVIVRLLEANTTAVFECDLLRTVEATAAVLTDRPDSGPNIG